MQMPGVDVETLKKRVLCADCVGEAYLKNEIAIKGKRRKCTYCESIGASYSIDNVSCEVERAFEDHFVRTATEPDGFEYALLSDKDSTYDWEREGEETIYAVMNAADIPEAAARDIQEVLEDKHAEFDSSAMGDETEFDSDAHYIEKGTSDEEWQTEWRAFERSLKSQARFFNQTGAQHLTAIFKDIEMMETRQKRRAVVDAGPGTPITGFFRARVFHSPAKVEAALIKPNESIGPPPSSLARAGRMNAHGISVFYGADDPLVALAEIRPPVGSWAVVMRFEIIRPLRLLDLAALVDITTVGSVFDPLFKPRLARIKFLRSLSQRLTIPVMPDDEPFEYLITQAIADFLATDSGSAVDGILFPSVQAAGSAGNVVLFHKSSRVEEIELPPGTKVTSRAGLDTEDGWEFDFDVMEEVPARKPTKKKLPRGFEHLEGLQDFTQWSPRPADHRPCTLKADLSSVTVHEVKAVAFKTDDYPVTRRRFKARTNLFGRKRRLSRPAT